ncbi:MAG: uroporphyrinogen decarboxylase family protein [Dehalococcoidia bacterium]
MAEMTKRERVRAVLMGEEIDRTPVAFWGHDYVREWTAEGTAAAMLEMTEKWDLDILKVNPRATYYMEAWGSQADPSTDPTKGGELTSFGVEVAEDLLYVDIADPGAGAFAEQLDALQAIRDGLNGNVPFVQTVFSPLTVLGRMTEGGPKRVREFIAEDSAAVHQALDSVAETLAAYARTCVDVGADGIFYATVDWGTKNMISEEQYLEYGRPYDLRVLSAVRGAPLNMLHVCRSNNLLTTLLDYPVEVFNWDARAEGNPTLAEVAATSDRGIMGGIGQVKPLADGSPDEVAEEARDALRQTEGRRFILSAGCSISPQTPPENVAAALAVVRGSD